MILPPPKSTIKYLHEDEEFIIVDKPANMLSVPGRTPDKKDCLISRIQARFPGALIVHRLDFGTSGLMVIALNRESHRELSRQFQDRETKKTYIAEVYGKLENDSGEINLPLRCDWERRPRQIVDHELGKKAQTFWQIIKRTEQSCRIKLTPITGRSHQLRVHMQAINHPILGDDLYAHESAFSMANRLLLHAKTLLITHPSQKIHMEFSADVPF